MQRSRKRRCSGTQDGHKRKTVATCHYNKTVATCHYNVHPFSRNRLPPASELDRDPPRRRQVCQTHVAGLGAIGFPQSPADRIAFWTKLHQRLATLANRIDGATHGAILAAVHARIPMPTRDDQRAVQLDNARTDARVWEALSDAQADRIAGLKGLAAHAAQAVAKAEPAAAKAADAALKAAERLARAEQGEDGGGGGMPLTHKGFP